MTDDEYIEQVQQDIEVQTHMAISVAISMTPPDYQLWYVFNGMFLSLAFIQTNTAEIGDSNANMKASTLLGDAQDWLSELYTMTFTCDEVVMPQNLRHWIQSNVGWIFEQEQQAYRRLMDV